MSIGHILYQLLLAPLILIYELVFGLAKGYTDNNGFSIFVLSLTVNVLLLPLYKRADAIQDEERALEKKMERWVTHIKKTFSGDERFMMLQAYYRENDYKPYYALKGSLPLLLEIPFFIAAYRFLSGLSALNGSAFGPIKDLGAPDGLLTIAGVSINVLPILMTLINFVSSTIYAKGFSLKDKVKLYGMAVIFLVLLYDSPSGLVVYWTLNNLFSLFKNIFMKIKNAGTIISAVLFAAGLAVGAYGVFFFDKEFRRARLFLVILALIMVLPLLLRPFKDRLSRLKGPAGEDVSTGFFWGGSVFMTLLTGALIPSAVVLSSPSEFVTVSDYHSPLLHIVNALLIAAGMFMIWMAVFYYIAGKKAKPAFCLGLWAVSGIAVMDYMFFATDLGTLSAQLRYLNGMGFGIKEMALNLAAAAVLAAVFALIWKKSKVIVKIAYGVMCVAVLGMSISNVLGINRQIPRIKESVQNISGEFAHIELSRTGKNVMVIMLDRAISAYIPYIMNEKPELKEQFAGFTYYPQTLSYGSATNVAMPSVFGGYEYIPDALNARPELTMSEKHNEALKLMPVIFSNAGYKVTFLDPVYANYNYITDTSLFDEYPGIEAYVTEDGRFNQYLDSVLIHRVWERNFFCYSLAKCSPLLVQVGLYNGGLYYNSNSIDTSEQTAASISTAVGLPGSFMTSYSVLKSLPGMTLVTDEPENTLLCMVNSATHEPALLSEPEYEPTAEVDNTEYDLEHASRFSLDGKTIYVGGLLQMPHYHVNMAALLRMGEWFDYLRAQGVYDNTRIIITSDHGRNQELSDDYLFGTAGYEDISYFNPIMLVKDFGETEFKTDDRFMTNADCPVLAFKDLIEDPVNPFTGNKVDDSAKYAEEHHVHYTFYWQPDKNNGGTFAKGVWFSVKGNILDKNNWTTLGVY